MALPVSAEGPARAPRPSSAASTPVAADQPRPADRRDRILATAAELFRRHGFVAVGVDAIGEGAGVSGPAIYRYFTSKNDILGVLFDRGMDELERATRVDDAAPRERLVLMAHGHASLVMRNPSLASVWLTEQRSLAGLHRARYAARAEGYRTRWSDTLHECFPAARPVTCGALVMPLLAVLNAVDQWPPELRTASTLSRLIDAVVAGIEAALGPPG